MSQMLRGLLEATLVLLLAGALVATSLGVRQERQYAQALAAECVEKERRLTVERLALEHVAKTKFQARDARVWAINQIEKNSAPQQ